MITKECVGFREPGCRECILRNIDKLNDDEGDLMMSTIWNWLNEEAD